MRTVIDTALDWVSAEILQRGMHIVSCASAALYPTDEQLEQMMDRLEEMP